MMVTIKIRINSWNKPGIDEDTKKEIVPRKNMWCIPNGVFYILGFYLKDGKFFVIRTFRVE